MVTIQYGSVVIDIQSGVDSYVSDVLHECELKTGVPREHIKLIANGKVLSSTTRVSDLPHGVDTKIVMLGSKVYEQPPEILPRIRDDLTVEGQSHRRKYAVNARNVTQIGRIRSQHRFHSIETLPGLPEEQRAREILQSLAEDPGILAVLEKHKWSVGALCELYPEGYVGVSDVCVMGLNENHGQRILLRLRTDDLKGFRKILTIRKVLFHELAHNEHSDHDDSFYMLMRQVEREAGELDWRQGRGRSVGGGTGGGVRESVVSEPSTAPHTLGGMTPSVPGKLMASAAALEREMLHEKEEQATQDICKAEEKDQEGEVCCGCSRKFVGQQYMESVPISAPFSENEGSVIPQEVGSGKTRVESSGTSGGTIFTDIDSLGDIQARKHDVMAAVDGALANYLAIAGETGLPDRLLQVREALEEVCSAAGTLRQLEQTLRVVADIVRRAKDTQNPRYRSIRKTNKLFSRTVVAMNALPALYAAGFEESPHDTESVVLSREDPALLYMVHSVIDVAASTLKSERLVESS
mmetsp:Transcript_693/g.1137  ORF Transcript_693/g.1137 Transcript_693/m.1137 type:complete len:524 (+) Transcript_693:85-1656(+)|eukprot:CAMPEP_0185029814 /NCGR_PEP_ID=MMETSP1103-20130426/16361_1 /TAXON_ID=36769 /ORGANISM="Paraphysomonas bandaiensis, Strain Caron Lab Isolate" /LENGTH=523 /DNA_ID=CAMNT_0027564705 /DNA_START=80 /DNA_END=1651 /DNA_ORIENTATION=+